jgi:ADP-heptose:LPS heptosyltransferase
MSAPKYTVLHLTAEQRKAIRADDVRKWPKGWVLTYITKYNAIIYGTTFRQDRIWRDDAYADVARNLRLKDCIAATLAYPEVA